MTRDQWQTLVRLVNGEKVEPLPAAFIIDSPWLPGWAGQSIMDYYASEEKWLAANLHALRRYPGVMFLPGFWSEYGMLNEPSAFGAKCIWHENDLPFAEKTIREGDALTAIAKPDCRKDGLLPLVLRRLVNTRAAIEAAGHEVRFAVARGPLNIASFLMGTTEFMIALKEQPDETRAFLGTITEFLVDWLRLQKETIPTIDGIFVLDDLAGFLGNDDFTEFAAPVLKQVFEAFPSAVRFFHNDAGGLVCAPHLPDIGVNLFNFSFNHSIAEMKTLTHNRVVLLGNVPPRDVMAGGTPDEVRTALKASLAGVTDRTRILLSVGGGMAPKTPSANIEAFIETAAAL